MVPNRCHLFTFLFLDLSVAFVLTYALSIDYGWLLSLNVVDEKLILQLCVFSLEKLNEKPDWSLEQRHVRLVYYYYVYYIILAINSNIIETSIH